MRKLSRLVLGRKGSGQGTVDIVQEDELQPPRKNSRKGSAQIKGSQLQNLSSRKSFVIEAQAKVRATCSSK